MKEILNDVLETARLLDISFDTDGSISVDSITLVEFVVALEDKFAIELPLEMLNLENLSTVSSIVFAISKTLKSNNKEG